MTRFGVLDDLVTAVCDDTVMTNKKHVLVIIIII